jgi:hypothetical protein
MLLSQMSHFIFMLSTGAQAHENEIPLTYVYSHGFFCP